MKPTSISYLMIVSFMLLSILACTGTFTATFPSPTDSVLSETATLPPPPTPTPDLTLTSAPLHEENQNPSYEIKAQVPALEGSTDARVVNFNTAMLNLVHTEINTFKKNVSELPPAAASISPASFLDVTYTLTLQRGDLWSFKFNFSLYMSGAAHPYDYTLTVNYDLGQGRQLVLNELFLPNSNYLALISNYCITELKEQPYVDSSSIQGANPTPENYRNWNITSDGLLITFDEGSVAAYAAGPQKIVMPYSELQTIIDPAGPLAGITP